MRRATVAPLLAAAVALTGCAGGSPLPSPALESRIDVDTPELRAAKKDVGVAPCPEPGGRGSDLPEITLPCLGGGRDVELAGVSGPAVVSLWASWCTSCPDELPLYQRLADEAGDRVAVLGVDYQDTQPGAALALLDKTRARFPQLADPGGDLADHYRLTGLPGILLVDTSGRVHFELDIIEDYAELTALVAEHTGVRLRGR
jgi:thiol-disulfide isomerase/thioredoxin